MVTRSGLVSVIIPTYNRFAFVLNTIASVKAQTYPHIEIIVVNDCSTEAEYYTHDWTGIRIIHLDENSRKLFGYASCGYVRNKGIEVASGEYIAFCDDDDIWFPQKLGLQLAAMAESGCQMSSTDGIVGSGVYDPTKTYPRYNAEHYYATLQNIYRRRGRNELRTGFPRIWTRKFMLIHNCMIASSVVVKKSILDAIGNMKHVRNGAEDYDCWLRCLALTNSVYVSDNCFYYDGAHGNGRQY
jgi:glycosyltransferase involved in cell wall biosynthesis